jgi:hypothetical protein
MSVRDVLRRYKQLYDELKSERIAKLIENECLDAEVRRKLVGAIRHLPHPELASIWDIKYVCKQILAGELEYLYKILGRFARELYDDVSELYPERVDERPLSASPKDLVYFLAQVNDSIACLRMDISYLSRVVQDIVLKGVCPKCGADLVETIENDKLILRCRGLGCGRKWVIGTAR